MSAGLSAYVTCDHLDRSAPVGHKMCPERIDEGETKAEVRRVARQRGWLTGVHSDGSRGTRQLPGRWDYCPGHKPTETALHEQ